MLILADKPLQVEFETEKKSERSTNQVLTACSVSATCKSVFGELWLRALKSSGILSVLILVKWKKRKYRLQSYIQCYGEFWPIHREERYWLNT